MIEDFKQNMKPQEKLNLIFLKKKYTAKQNRILLYPYIPTRHLLVQIQQMKYQSNVWNIFDVNSKTPKQRQWSRSGVINVNFEQISHIFPVFPLLTLSKYMTFEWKVL